MALYLYAAEARERAEAARLESRRRRYENRELAVFIACALGGVEIPQIEDEDEDEDDAEVPPPDTVKIIVDGEEVEVPRPPPGWAYDKDGKLFEAFPTKGHAIGDSGHTTKASPRVI